MSRTLQRILLVAAMAGAPLVATASPDTSANPPRTEVRASPEGSKDSSSFFARIFAKMRERAAMQSSDQAAPAQSAQSQTPNLPSLDKLPRWLKAFFDADAAAADRTRSTGT